LGTKKSHEISVLDEAELLDPILDPRREIPTDFEEGMKVACVHRLDGVAADNDSAL
jgi:hypothetical protein